MVFLAGIIKNPNIEKERIFFLLDVGLNNQKWVPVSTYKNESLLAKLRNIGDGDFIQLKAIIRPWSKKEDSGSWAHGLTIEIAEIKNLVTQRRQPQQKTPEPNRADIPW